MIRVAFRENLKSHHLKLRPSIGLMLVCIAGNAIGTAIDQLGFAKTSANNAVLRNASRYDIGC